MLTLTTFPDAMPGFAVFVDGVLKVGERRGGGEGRGEGRQTGRLLCVDGVLKMGMRGMGEGAFLPLRGCDSQARDYPS